MSPGWDCGLLCRQHDRLHGPRPTSQRRKGQAEHRVYKTSDIRGIFAAPGTRQIGIYLATSDNVLWPQQQRHK